MFEVTANDIPQLEQALQGKLTAVEVQGLVRKLEYTAKRLNMMMVHQIINEVLEYNNDPRTQKMIADGAKILLSQMVD